MFCFEVWTFVLPEPSVLYVRQIMEHKWKSKRIKDRKDMNEQYINGSWQEDGVSSEELASSSFLFILQSRKIPNNPVARIILPLADLPLFHITRRISWLLRRRLTHFNSTPLVSQFWKSSFPPSKENCFFSCSLVFKIMNQKKEIFIRYQENLIR